MFSHPLKLLIPLTLLATQLGVTNCGSYQDQARLHEAPDASNNFALMGVSSKKYQQVVTKASLPEQQRPWSGDYWPTYRGGIAHRWQTMRHGYTFRDFLYQVPNQQQIAKMTQQELDRLSPAEKYDLLSSTHKFALTKSELYRTQGSVDSFLGDVPHWYGICHGWVVAATAEPQPGLVAQVTAADGRPLNFYSSDIKALLSKYYAESDVASHFVGGRCDSQYAARDSSGRVIDSECRDVNPATFHLVMESYIAHKRQSVNVDIDSTLEVWTQPAFAYEFAYSKLRPLSAEPNYRHAARGTARLINVSFTMYYADEALATRHPIPTVVANKTYEYTLELDQNDFIIGGEWISAKHPDFMWQLHDSPHAQVLAGLDYKILKELVTLSLRRSS